MAEIIATDLGFPLDYVQWIDFSAGERLSAVKRHEVDIVADSMALTDSRKQQIRFGGP
ncbi:transporter substrate-binding domain-containing protein [Amycolatopsis kentuckyensis]|uniref:transporter substrate-binding domain-containing protein n=1 Tax=Amycolatopsis kentuckyensis TaxID=218823 RepID=UPI0035616811